MARGDSGRNEPRADGCRNCFVPRFTFAGIASTQFALQMGTDQISWTSSDDDAQDKDDIAMTSPLDVTNTVAIALNAALGCSQATMNSSR